MTSYRTTKASGSEVFYREGGVHPWRRCRPARLADLVGSIRPAIRAVHDVIEARIELFDSTVRCPHCGNVVIVLVTIRGRQSVDSTAFRMEQTGAGP